MEKTAWKKAIRADCEKIGTYKPSFDSIIDTLSAILEQRDAVMEQYQAEGSIPIVEYTNTQNHTNRSKNPLLVLVMDLNTQALAYWRDLGLTPAGLKKLNADVLNAKATADGFEALLARIAK